MPDTPSSLVAAPTERLPDGRRVAAFFDLDKTVIARSSALAFSRQFFAGGLLTRRAVLKSSYAQLMFLLTAADHDQVEQLRKHVTDMCRGWDVAQVRSIVRETLEEVVAPQVYAEAAALIADHHRRGHEVILVSASGIELVEPIGELLGVDHVRASRMRVVDGRYSGELDFYCYGEEKATAMRELADAHGYRLDDCFAYSDSITDLPMLDAVGHPVAVNPDRQLRRHAVDHGWQVLTFARPIPIRARVVAHRRPLALAALLAGVAATAAAFGVRQLLRRRAEK